MHKYGLMSMLTRVKHILYYGLDTYEDAVIAVGICASH